MRPILCIINGFISSLIFVFLISFAFNFTDLSIIVWMWLVFLLPIFLIGGSITLAIVFYLQKRYSSMSYFPSFIIFLLAGVIGNVFALWDLIRNGWDEGVLQYLILGMAGSLLYFHIWLLLHKIAVFLQAKVSMNPKKRVWISGSFLFIAVVMISFIFDFNQPRENRILGRDIHSIVEDKQNSEFHLKSLTDFTWDQAALFGPYTTKDLIEESLGVRYNGSTGGIDYREDRFLLVFLYNNQVVQYAFLDRKDGVDFTGVKGEITPSNDLIKIKRM